MDENINVRNEILSSVLMSVRGDLESLAPLHRLASEEDSYFYGKLAAWYMGHGEVRDHKILFVAHLLTSDYEFFREEGWALIQQFPPHMIVAVLDFAKKGIGKVPRMFKNAVATYLRELERNPAHFDRVALRSRKDLKHLYASLRLAPSDHAQRVLFDNNPPQDSPLFALKILAQTTDPQEQARIIIDAKIPYPIAVGALNVMAPSVLIALIGVMTPQEVINHLALLQRQEAFDNPELRALIERKLDALENDNRASSLKALKALKHVKLDEETKSHINSIVDRRVDQMPHISERIVLFVDRSGSMDIAISIAKEMAPLISAVCDDLRVFTFNGSAKEIIAQGTQRSDWEKAFKGVYAGGGTSIGAPLDVLRKERYVVDRIIIISDMEDNTNPLFHYAYKEYVGDLDIKPPNVCVVGCGDFSGFERSLAKLYLSEGIPLQYMRFDGDYYSLPNLLPMLAQPSRAELIEQIMEVSIPTRPRNLDLTGTNF